MRWGRSRRDVIDLAWVQLASGCRRRYQLSRWWSQLLRLFAGVAASPSPQPFCGTALSASYQIGYWDTFVITFLAPGLDAADAAKAEAINTGDVSVYTSTNSAGATDYVGTTNNPVRRAAAQFADKGIDINVIPGLENLSRADALGRAELIEESGGPGRGPLRNKINSISASNPIYDQSIQRGCAILATVGFPAPNVCG